MYQKLNILEITKYGAKILSLEYFIYFSIRNKFFICNNKFLYYHIIYTGLYRTYYG